MWRIENWWYEMNAEWLWLNDVLRSSMLLVVWRCYWFDPLILMGCVMEVKSWENYGNDWTIWIFDLWSIVAWFLQSRFRGICLSWAVVWNSAGELPNHYFWSYLNLKRVTQVSTSTKSRNNRNSLQETYITNHQSLHTECQNSNFSITHKELST